MGGILENPLLFLIEDAEPILPILRSARYNPDSRKIVELTDVGCDTETTYPVRFPRGAFDRRRGGAENFESIRGFAKWRGERPNNFPARAATARDHHFSGRNENRVGRKARRNNRVYDDAYITSDLDYDSLAEDFFDDLKLAGRNDSTLYKRGYYNEHRNPWNTIGRSRKESPVRDTRYDYSEDFESRKYDEQTENQRENIYSCWFADNDERNVHGARDIDARSRLSPSNYFRKRTKIRTRIDEDFNRDAEYEKHHGMPKRHERENVFLDIAADSVVPTKDDFWDFISSENEPTREETSFSKSARVKDHGHPSRTTSKGRRGSRNLDSWRKYVHVNDTGKMNNIAETREKQNSENLSPIENARYQISRDNNDGEIWRSNLLNANPPRIRSARISNDEQLPDNIRPTGRAYTRLRSAVEHRKVSINSSTSTEKREESANSTSPRTKAHRRSRDKFGYGATVKLFDKPFGQAGRPTKIPRLIIADSKNNERTYTANKEDDVNRRAEVSAKNTKADRADRNSLSRSIFERGDEGTSASNRVFRITSVSSSTETERRKKRKCSRLPVRTWKRVRTREPTALRLKSDVTGEALNRGLRVTDVVHRETARPSNQSGQARVDEVLPNETIASGGANGDRDNVVRNDRCGTRSVGTAKSRLTSINLKDLKRTECDSNARNGRNARASRTENKRQ